MKSPSGFEFQPEGRFDDRVGGERNSGADDGTASTVYRSTATAELTTSSQSSPRHVSPLPPAAPSPQSHRVLTPPMLSRAGEMPFIADRTFPLPVTTDVPRTTWVSEALPPPPSVSGVPSRPPRSPGGASPKPPPPPRTVSVMSSLPRGAETLQPVTSDPPPVPSSQSSSSESSSSFYSHHHSSERFSSSDKYVQEASTSYGRQSEDGAAMRTTPSTVPLRMAASHSPSRHIDVGDFDSQQQQQQHFEYPVGLITASVLGILFSSNILSITSIQELSFR